MKTLLISAASAVSLFASASATELVSNGSFEDGLTDWMCVTNNLCEARDPFGVPAFDGDNALVGFDNTSFSTLSQGIETVAGEDYELSFWTFATADVDGNLFSFAVDGGIAQDVELTLDWAQTTWSFTASGTATLIEFFFETDPGTGIWNLDLVSVEASAIPVPAALPLMLAGLGALGAAKRRKSA